MAIELVKEKYGNAINVVEIGSSGTNAIRVIKNAWHQRVLTSFGGQSIENLAVQTVGFSLFKTIIKEKK